MGRAVAQLVEALCYKQENGRFSMVSLEFFIDKPSVHTMALKLTQPLPEMSTRSSYWGVKAAGA
jgi:hypothetical protein